MRVVYKHPMRRSRCFVFDNLFELARFLLRQNQSVQLRLLYVYVPHTSLHHIDAISVGAMQK